MAENQEGGAPEPGGKSMVIKVVILVALLIAVGVIGLRAWETQKKNAEIMKIPPPDPNAKGRPIDPVELQKAVIKGMAEQNKINREKKAAEEAAKAAANSEGAPAAEVAPAEGAAPTEAAPAEAPAAEGAAPAEAPAAEAPQN